MSSAAHRVGPIEAVAVVSMTFRNRSHPPQTARARLKQDFS